MAFNFDEEKKPSFRRLEQDEKRHDYIWYANATKYWSGNLVEVEFEMFNPTDWKRYEAYYNPEERTLCFDQDSIYENYNTVELFAKFIEFLQSDEFKNLVISKDPMIDYIWEIF